MKPAIKILETGEASARFRCVNCKFLITIISHDHYADGEPIFATDTYCANCQAPSKFEPVPEQRLHQKLYIRDVNCRKCRQYIEEAPITGIGYWDCGFCVSFICPSCQQEKEINHAEDV